jgi:23S rRNA pseudouridine2605 synthase
MKGVRFEELVSGTFDREQERPQSEPKRVLSPEPEAPKLHKVLAQSGLGSRLDMERLIAQGVVSVNQEVAHVGQRVKAGDQIKVNGRLVHWRAQAQAPRVLAYHKPVGEVVTLDDPLNRPTVFRSLPRLHHGKWQSVGRLDLNTEGLLLFTNSGELANQLMHPRFGLEREYAARVLGALSKEEKERLLQGIELDDGTAQLLSIEDGGGEGANCWYRVTIAEGRNREVRRLFEALGHAVSRLIRIRYGAMMLPQGLKRGAWLELDERDVAALMRSARQPQQRARPMGADSLARQRQAQRQARSGKKR